MTPPKPAPLSLLSVNVNGLGVGDRARRLFHFLVDTAGNPDVVFLQELKVADAAALHTAMQHGRGIGLPYRAAAFCSPGTVAARGVAILVREGSLLYDSAAAADVVRVHSDSEGRFLRVDFPLMCHDLSLICVYAPNSGHERDVFFSSLTDLVPDGRTVLMGGDFNCICDTDLDQIPPDAGRHRLAGAASLTSLMQHRGLVDAFRCLHPADATAVTHVRASVAAPGQPAHSMARLDRWLVSEEVVHDWGCSTPRPLPGLSDHLAVCLRVCPPALPSLGRGRPTFPLHLLSLPEWCERLGTWLAEYVDANPPPSSPAECPGLERWLRLKEALLAKARALDCEWRRKSRQQVAALQQAATVAMSAAAAMAAPAPAAPTMGSPTPGEASSRMDGTATQRPPSWPLNPHAPPFVPRDAASSSSSQDMSDVAAAASASGADDSELDRRVDDIMRALKAMRDQVAFGADMTARAACMHWEEYGERCTATHFAMGKALPRASLISTLRDRAGVVYDLGSVASGHDLNTPLFDYFSGNSPCGLFRVGAVNVAAQDAMLASIDRRLSPEQAEAAEGPEGDGTITLECLAAALVACQNGKSPGRDGLPYEVYKRFWDELGPLLTDALADVFEHGPHSAEWAQGVIALLYKGKGARDDLASYRPITLLNCDYKLASRVISDRLQRPLDFLIDPCQTAFIAGRCIDANIHTRQLLADYLDAEQEAGVMLIMDVSKAYDRVDRGWLMRCAVEMGLPAGMRRWFERFMADTTAQVTVNGWLSGSFPVCNGLPQGGPLAPPLYVLQQQPLAAALRRAQAEGRLSAPRLAGCDGQQGDVLSPLGMHADDLKLFLSSLRDGEEAWRLIELHQAASNALMNKHKTRGLCLGTHAMPPDGKCGVTGADFNLREGESCITALGIPCTTNPDVAADSVFPARVAACRAVAERWSAIPMTLAGRILNSMQAVLSMVVYFVAHVAAQSSTARYDKQLMSLTEGYIAGGQRPEDATVSYGSKPCLLPQLGIARLPTKLGGMGAPDLPSQMISLRAKAVAVGISPAGKPYRSLLLAQLRRAAPHPRWGPVWLFSDVPVPSDGRLSAYMRAIVTAYRDSQPQPHTPPGGSDLPARALLLMPLYFNRHLLDADGKVLQPPAQPPDEWPFTLQQLAECSADLRQHAALQAVQACLPDPWRRAMHKAIQGERALADEDEWWLSGCGRVARKKGGPDGGGFSYALARSSGLLDWLPGQPSGTTSPRLPWRPACVLTVPKPRIEWTAEETAAYDMAAPEEKAAARPTQPQVLDVWARVEVYPDAWAHGGVPLSCYNAATVRRLLTLQACMTTVRKYQPHYVPGQPMQPRLWSTVGATTEPSLSSVETSPSATAGGLASVERSWTAQCAAVAADAAAEQLDLDAGGCSGRISSAAAGAAVAAALPASMRLDVQRPARAQPRPRAPPDSQPGASDRLGGVAEADVAAGLEAPLPTPPLQDGRCTEYGQFWKAVHTTTLPKHYAVFAYRLAHAALPCNAMRVARLGARGGSAACPLCCGPGPLAAGPLETYSHLFLECPACKPAVEWLADVWLSIAGERPPLTAAVIVADDPAAWPQRPAGVGARMWSALRIALLYHIWEARQSGDPTSRSAHSIVRATVSALRQAMQMQYNRLYASRELEQHLPARVIASRNGAAAKADLTPWLQYGLCYLEARLPAAASQQASQHTATATGGGSQLRRRQRTPPLALHITLTVDTPVPGPPPPPSATRAPSP